MYTIRELQSIGELQECVRRSSERYPDDVFPIDPLLAYTSLRNMIQQRAFFRIIERDKEIVAWGIATIINPVIYNRSKALSQHFYQGFLSGFSAVKCMRMFHKEMVLHAVDKKIPVCMSTSLLNNKALFHRILERDGWEHYRGGMIFKVEL